MAAMRRSLKERIDGPAPLIEGHYDPRRSIFALVRVRDAVANQGEGAGLVLDAISSARDGFIQRKRWIFIGASGENGHQQQG